MGQAASSEEVSDGLILAVAAREGHAEVVQMYLQKNAALAFHVNRDGSTVVQAACEGGQHQILKALLASLKLSAASNTFDPVKKLLNQVNTAGRTALSLAAAGSSPWHAACVHSLLQADASVWIVDNEGRSCLHHAALQGSRTVLDLLLNAAAWQPQEEHLSEPLSTEESGQAGIHRFVNLRDAAGRSSLLCAVYSSNMDSIHTLVTAGANLTAAATNDSLESWAPVNQGATPLHIAALRADTPAAVLLLTAYITAAAGALSEPDHGSCACTCQQCQDSESTTAVRAGLHLPSCQQQCCAGAGCEGSAGKPLLDPRSIADAYGLTPYAVLPGDAPQNLKQLLNPHTIITELLEALPDGPAHLLQAAAASAGVGSGDQVALVYRQLARALSNAGSYLTSQQSLQEPPEDFKQQQLQQTLHTSM